MSIQDKRKELAKWILNIDENVLNEVEAIYNVHSKSQEISDVHKKVLDERLKLHNENPNRGRNWNEVKAELSSKYGF
ncbi:MAG: addiction module protein [Flavobacteriaceae bacterium]